MAHYRTQDVAGWPLPEPRCDCVLLHITPLQQLEQHHRLIISVGEGRSPASALMVVISCNRWGKVEKLVRPPRRTLVQFRPSTQTLRRAGSGFHCWKVLLSVCSSASSPFSRDIALFCHQLLAFWNKHGGRVLRGGEKSMAHERRRHVAATITYLPPSKSHRV